MGVIPRVDVLGVGISAVDMTSAVAAISRMVGECARSYVCVTGVHGVMESQRDPSLANIHNRSGLTTPDGMPMVWAGRFAGSKQIRRVYGPDLMLEVCKAGLGHGWRHFLYGGAEGVAPSLRKELNARFPGIQVVGTSTPPFRPLTPEERQDVIRSINGSRADIVWVGLSTPKQERWMADIRPELEAAVLIGVGAAFDLHTGRIRQAPSWMQRSGLEWLFRLAIEPRRLWRRYLRNNPAFLWRVLKSPPFIRSVSVATESVGSSGDSFPIAIGDDS